MILKLLQDGFVALHDTKRTFWVLGSGLTAPRPIRIPRALGVNVANPPTLQYNVFFQWSM
jgi:hypothetical protein